MDFPLVRSEIHLRKTFIGDLKHWEKAIPEEDSKNPWLSQPNSINVEITAYALLTLVSNNQITEGLPIMKWLLSQQNENGGFQSTQDTVVGLTALAKYAEKLAFGDSNAVVGVSYKNGSESAISVNKENSLLLQTLEVKSSIPCRFFDFIRIFYPTDSIRCTIN